MKKFVLLFSILFLLSILSISANAYEDMGSFFVCYNCSDCTDALNNNTYNEVRLTQNITNQIETCINNPENFTNKIFDCQEHLISGIGENYGFYLSGKENNTIKNCNIVKFGYSIYLNESNNNMFLNNKLENNVNYGIFLYNSSNNTFNDNLINGNNYGLYCDFSNYNFINFTTISNNTYGIYLTNSINNTITSTTISSAENYGVYLLFSYGNNFTNSSVDYSIYGIYIEQANYNLIENNNIKYNKYGLYVKNSLENLILNNIIQENQNFDIFGEVDLEENCNNIIMNNIGSGNRPIGFYNGSINLENEIFSELILCNASYSNLNNITITGSDTLNNNGLILIYTGHSNLTNINSTGNNLGVGLLECDYNSLENITSDLNTYGFTLLLSNNNYISGSNFELNYIGISLGSSNSNTIFSSKINSNFFGFVLGFSNNNHILNTESKNNSLIIISSSGSTNQVSNLDIGYKLNFVSKDIVMLNRSSPAPDPSGYKNIGKYLYIANTSANNSWIYFNISYQESELGGNDESTLRIFRYDTSWAQLSGSGVDTVRNYVYSGNVTSFSVFAPMVKITTTGGAPGGIISRVPTPNITQQQNQTNVTNQTACRIFNLTELSYYPNYTLEISICDEVIFALNEKTYNLTLVEIKNNSVVLRLDSITIPLTNATSIDLDEDEIEDLSIKLEKISEQNVTLTFSLIPKPEEREEKKEEIIPPEKKEEINWNLFVLIFIIFFILLVLIFLLAQKSKERKRKKKH
ncbi:MAG: NosD domain-containing protein [Candidatus Aenigmatarchaeota archaeon]